MPQATAEQSPGAPRRGGVRRVEKFKTWSDCGDDLESSFTKDELLDNVMVYWLNAAAASSARLYWHSLTSSAGSFWSTPDETLDVDLRRSASHVTRWRRAVCY